MYNPFKVSCLSVWKEVRRHCSSAGEEWSDARGRQKGKLL